MERWQGSLYLRSNFLPWVLGVKGEWTSPFKSWGNLGSLKVAFSACWCVSPLKERFYRREGAPHLMACCWEELGTPLWFSKDNENGAPSPSPHLPFNMKARFITKKNERESLALTRFQGGGNCTHSFRNLLSFPSTEDIYLLMGHRTFFRLGCSPDFLRHSTVSCCNHYFLYLAANKIITGRWFGLGP